MLMPKKRKYRKEHKRRRGGKASRLLNVSFGSYGLKATTESWVNSRQIEAARRVMSRHLKKTGKLWIRIFPDKPVTKKSGEIGMGGGKGPVDHYICVVKPGTVMFELEGLDEKAATEALRLASHKLPVKTKVVSR